MSKETLHPSPEDIENEEDKHSEAVPVPEQPILEETLPDADRRAQARQGENRREFLKKLPFVAAGLAGVAQEQAQTQMRRRPEKYYEGLPEKIVKEMKEMENVTEAANDAKQKAKESYFILAKELNQKKKDKAAISAAYTAWQERHKQYDELARKLNRAYREMNNLIDKETTAIQQSALKEWSRELFYENERHLDRYDYIYGYGGGRDRNFLKKLQERVDKALGSK